MRRNTVSFVAAGVLAIAGTALCPAVTFAQQSGGGGLSAPLGGSTGAPSSAPAANTPVAPATTSSIQLPANAATDYQLDTGDTVYIDVMKHADVSGPFSLSADATVAMNRTDAPIMARGMTCKQLGDAVYKALNNPRNFNLRRSQVAVRLTGARFRRIYVSGSAVKGGDYNLLNGWHISDLVSIVGGVPQPDRVKARLTSPRRPEPIPVNLEQALKDRHGPEDLALMEDDTLVIDAPKAKTFFVEGEGPRGKYDIDERFSLKQALVQIGIAESNPAGDLTQGIIHRHTVPGDPSSPTEDIKINLMSVLDGTKQSDVQDFDTLEIPASTRFYYMFGEAFGPRKRLMPLDRPTFLIDAMADSGATTGQAKIGDIRILRTDAQGQAIAIHVDYGKYFKSNGDPQYNPEILPGDKVFVPNVKRTSPLETFWNTFGVFGALRSFIPGL